MSLAIRGIDAHLGHAKGQQRQVGREMDRVCKSVQTRVRNIGE